MRTIGHSKVVLGFILVFALVGFAAPLPVISTAVHNVHHAAASRAMDQTIENNSQGKLYPVTRGTWGGQSMNFTVEKDSVTIEFDCADGSIPRQLKADKHGNFKIEGTLTPRSPGPVRRDSQPQPQPAIYQGKITGKIATIKVTLAKTNESAGEFTIERGKTTLLTRCY